MIKKKKIPAASQYITKHKVVCLSIIVILTHLQGETECQGKCRNPEAEEGRAETPGSREASAALST